MKIPDLLLLLIVAVPIALVTGCLGENDNEVIVYVALDREFSRPILDKFEKETGIRVLAKYDVESNKTTGLANAILSERNRPRCDLFWNNEIVHSIRLSSEGLALPFAGSAPGSYPPNLVAADFSWHGFAARARVLIVNTGMLPNAAEYPGSIDDLIDVKWKGNCGIARPLFGTTATHAAVLFQKMGAEKAIGFFEKVKANCIVETGNRQVAKNVALGRYAWGITDTDDAIIEIEQGSPVAIVWPDQEDSQPGTLVIPNTLMVVRDGPNEANAVRLAQWLLEGDTEKLLAECPSAQIPQRLNVSIQSRIWPVDYSPKIFRPDFTQAAAAYPTSTEQLVRIFE